MSIAYFQIEKKELTVLVIYTILFTSLHYKAVEWLRSLPEHDCRDKKASFNEIINFQELTQIIRIIVNIYEAIKTPIQAAKPLRTDLLYTWITVIEPSPLSKPAIILLDFVRSLAYSFVFHHYFQRIYKLPSVLYVCFEFSDRLENFTLPQSCLTSYVIFCYSVFFVI